MFCWRASRCFSMAGFHSVTGEQLFICKLCKKRLFASDPVRIHHKTWHLASDIFSRVANKSPVRGTIWWMTIKIVDTYYSIIDFINRCCYLFSWKFDRRMIDGEGLVLLTVSIKQSIWKLNVNWPWDKSYRKIYIVARLITWYFHQVALILTIS